MCSYNRISGTAIYQEPQALRFKKINSQSEIWYLIKQRAGKSQFLNLPGLKFISILRWRHAD